MNVNDSILLEKAYKSVYLREMAINSESDIIYLSELLNRNRTIEPEYGEEANFRITTSTGYRKAVQRNFGSKIAIPLRIVINDIGVPRNDIEDTIHTNLPTDNNCITIVINASHSGGDQPFTPWMIGHRLGHVVVSESKFWFGVVKVLQLIVKHYPDRFLPTVSAVIDEMLQDGEEYGADCDLTPELENIITTLTPNLKNKFYDPFVEWGIDLIAMYFKYGHITFHVGEKEYTRLLDRMIDAQLHQMIGRIVYV